MLEHKVKKLEILVRTLKTESTDGDIINTRICQFERRIQCLEKQMQTTELIISKSLSNMDQILKNAHDNINPSPTPSISSQKQKNKKATINVVNTIKKK